MEDGSLDVLLDVLSLDEHHVDALLTERCLRHAVMYRKTSSGTQSSEGSRFVERILTAVTTLELQRRGALDFLTDTLKTHRRGLAAPSLLLHPEPAHLANAA